MAASFRQLHQDDSITNSGFIGGSGNLKCHQPPITGNYRVGSLPLLLIVESWSAARSFYLSCVAKPRFEELLLIGLHYRKESN